MSAGKRNEDFYDRFWQDCPDFTRYNPGARHRRRIVLEMLATLPGHSLLDVGCGRGELLVSVDESLPAYQHLVGVDLSSETVEQNRRRLPTMDFSSLDISRESLRRTFDVVVCTEVVEHLDDRPTAFANLARMVAPGGHLVITCPTGHVYATEKHFGHVDHPTSDELSTLAHDVDLQTVRIQSWGWPLYKALKWATNVNSAWAIDNFASGTYSRAAKLVSDALYWVNYFNLPSSTRGCQLFAVFTRPGR